MSVTVTNSTNTLTITVGRQGPSGAGAQTAADIRALGFFDTSNDGTGSGLDADTVDGNEASALLARANHTGTQPLSTISDAGTAAALDVGTGPNEVVQLNGSSELPAVSGANLTNLPSGATQLSELSDVGETTATNRNVLVADGDSWESRALTEADISDLGSYITSVAAADITDATADGIALITSADANPFTDAEKSKLDSVESGANFTDATTIQAAGALMDSEVTNLAAVKAFDPTDYATAAQGATADSAVQPADISGLTGGTTGQIGTKASGDDYDFTFSDDLTVPGLLTADHIHGNLAGTLYIHVKNTSGITLAKGTPVYVTGHVGSSDRVEVAAADQSNAAKMPAIALLEEELINNAEGNGVVVGEIRTLDTVTPSYALNDEIFVGVGALTETKPTTGIVQPVATVGRLHESTGVLVVNCQGARTPDESFATAAQGALADSAVQTSDIDTLAELNAIVTDATLIDTNDSRLSDARTPTAHAHTLSEITDAGTAAAEDTDAFVSATAPFWVEVVLTGAGEDIATGTKVAMLTHTVAGTITGFKLVCDPANEPSAAAVQVDMNAVDLSTGAATSRLSAVAQIATSANVSTGGTISGTQTVAFGDQSSFDIDQGSDGKELRGLVQITPSAS